MAVWTVSWLSGGSVAAQGDLSERFTRTHLFSGCSPSPGGAAAGPRDYVEKKKAPPDSPIPG